MFRRLIMAVMIFLWASQAGGPFDTFGYVQRLKNPQSGPQRIKFSALLVNEKFNFSYDNSRVADLLSVPTKLVDNVLQYVFKGDTWIRIDFWSSFHSPTKVILANDYAMEGMIFFENQMPPQYFGINQYRSYKFAQPFFEFDVPYGLSTFFLKVSSVTHPSLISLRVWNPGSFREKMEHRLLSDLFLVVPAFLWLFHLGFFLLIGQRKYLYLLAASGGFLVFFALIRGHYVLTGWDSYFLSGSLLPLCLLIGVVGMTHFYFFIHHVNFQTDKKLFQVYVILEIVGILLSIYASFNLDKVDWWMFVPCILSASVSYWGSIRYRKVKRYQIGSIYMLVSVPFVVSALLFLIQVTGYLHFLPFDLDIQFITLSIFLVGISLVLGINSQRKMVESQRIKDSILLTNTVQELITPLKYDNKKNNLMFKSYYIPYENQMSGDWIQRWQSADGTQHFLIGDVAGKGPQAALAVGVISMAVHQASRLDQTMLQALQEINLSLLEVFHGAVTTTALGVTVFNSGEAYIYYAAHPAWILIKNGKPKLVSEAGPILGFEHHPDIKHQVIQLDIGDVILCFTDGFQPKDGNTRIMLKYLREHLKKENSTAKMLDSIVQWASHTVVHDDRAIFSLEKLGENDISCAA